MFGLDAHVGLMILALLAGIAFWLGDEFIAERTDINRQIDPLDIAAQLDNRDQYSRREAYVQTARRVGKGLVVIGIGLAVLLAVRLAL